MLDLSKRICYNIPEIERCLRRRMEDSEKV